MNKYLKEKAMMIIEELAKNNECEIDLVLSVLQDNCVTQEISQQIAFVKSIS
jgi:hypothetical protein